MKSLPHSALPILYVQCEAPSFTFNMIVKLLSYQILCAMISQSTAHDKFALQFCGTWYEQPHVIL